MCYDNDINDLILQNRKNYKILNRAQRASCWGLKRWLHTEKFCRQTVKSNKQKHGKKINKKSFLKLT